VGRDGQTRHRADRRRAPRAEPVSCPRDVDERGCIHRAGPGKSGRPVGTRGDRFCLTGIFFWRAKLLSNQSVKEEVEMSENRNPWPVLLVTVLGFFMIMLDTTIVYVATPSILSNLHASLDQILWVFNGYLLMSIFPSERRGAAFGVVGAVIGISTVAGPTLGGLIVTNWDWRWIFYLNLPIGILALAGTFLVIPDLRPGRRHRVDVVGVLLSSAALFAVVFGLIEGQRYEWGAISGWLTIPMVLAAGVALFLAFLVWERFQDEPLVPMSLFRDRNFSLMNWTGAAMFFAMQAIFIPITIYT